MRPQPRRPAGARDRARLQERPRQVRQDGQGVDQEVRHVTVVTSRASDVTHSTTGIVTSRTLRGRVVYFSPLMITYTVVRDFVCKLVEIYIIIVIKKFHVF